MKEFMERHGGQVKGVMSGWDRIALRGTIRWLSSVRGLGSYLACNDILLKDFAHWASSLTARVRKGCCAVAASLGIRTMYLRSGSVDKEALARRIAQEKKIETGPICLLSVVEPCWSPTVVGNRETRKLEIAVRQRKCVWLYLYWNDPQLGFGHVRLQSWLPFTIKGNINGRHWLERGLIDAGVKTIKSDNCFRWVADCARAQALLDAQLRTDWPRLLNGLVDRYFGVMRDLFGETPLHYYWSADETEWATDILFRNTAELDRLFPMLARYGLLVSDSASVMRYLGRIGSGAALPPRVSGDVRGDRRRRHEGVCAKHRVGRNSVKMYNKAGNVLRIETTINAPRDFRVFRQANDDPQRKGSWLPMRKGLADLERRARISQQSNERYLAALATCQTDATLFETVKDVCRRTRRKGRSVRALNPYGAHDLHLLRFLAQGQWSANGFRNRDLANWIDPRCADLAPDDRRRLSSRVTRLLGILRAHGLIRKVSKTHRYVRTPKGDQVATLVLSASTLQGKQLMEMAA
jgi:hypothetical protein